MDKVTSPTFPDDASDGLRGTTSWDIAKQTGLSWMPPGQPTTRCYALLKILEGMGIYVVPVGELEGFCRSVGGHGPKFVVGVLEKDLLTDAELAEAREFVTKLM